MTRRHFDKYQGLGNDFIVLHVEDPDSFSVEQAQALCHRNFGIGADGVLLASPALTEGAIGRMVVLNSDGSRPEMCGNGLRCVALDLARRRHSAGLAPLEQDFIVDTDAGPRRCVVQLSSDGLRASVKTHLGTGTQVGAVALDVDGTNYGFERFSMGNRHAVRFAEPVSLDAIDVVGPRVSSSLPGGSNVEFAVQKSPTEIDVIVWERGCGRTLACGTGAAATAVAAVVSGRSPADTPLEVRLPGGPLTLQVAAGTLDVELTGPAEWVFSGETSLHVAAGPRS